MKKTFVLFAFLLPASLSAQYSTSLSVDSVFHVVNRDGIDLRVPSSPHLFISAPNGVILFSGGSTEETLSNHSGWVRIPADATRPVSPVSPESVISLTYSNQIGWMEDGNYILSTRFTRTVVKAKSGPSPGGFRKSQADFVLETGRWVTAQISAEGIYQVSGKNLKDWGFSSSADLRNLRIFTSAGHRPQDSGLKEIPLFRKEGETPGFDENAVYYFYSPYVNGLFFDSTASRHSFYEDRLATGQFIYITIGTIPGKRINIITPGPAGTVTEASVKALAWNNQDIENLIGSGLEWYGNRIPANSSLIYTTRLPDYKTGTSIALRTKLVAQYLTSQSGRFSILESGRTIRSGISTGSVDSNPFDVQPAGKTGIYTATISSLTGTDRVNLEFLFTASGTAYGWLDWYELEYTPDLSANKVKADFYIDSALPGGKRVQVGGFANSHIEIWNLDNPLDPQKVNPEQINGGECAFIWDVKSNKGNRFLVWNSAETYPIPESVREVKAGNLSAILSQAPDYLIVTHPDFESEANRLLQHRNATGWNGAVVTTESIYQHYTGGKPNLYGIRNFLTDVRLSGNGALKNVLLFGDASFDYRNRLNRAESASFIPTFESEESLSEVDSYATDDEFSYLLPDGLYQVGIGRLPVRTKKEAATLVDKLIHYDQSSDPGAWRLLVSMVADDGLTTTGNDYDLHVSNAETVVSQVPVHLTKNKLYIVNYPTVTTSQGRRKPDAAKALVDLFNSGSAVINYSGHGNTKVWTHERVFEISDFLPGIRNKNRMPFVITATCDFGKFDDTDAQSAAELLILEDNGGAIGLFTTTRLVYTSRSIFSDNNLALNYFLFQNLFSKDEKGKNLTIGEIYVKTKNRFGQRDSRTGTYSFGVNVRKFSLLADPAMRIIFPETEAVIVQDTLKLDGLDTYQISSGNLNEIDGIILKPDGSQNQQFTGRIEFRVKSEPVRVNVTEWQSEPRADVKSFLIDGPDVFRGSATISNGNFSIRFIAPKDIIPNNVSPGRFEAYIESQGTTGYLTSPRIYYLSGQEPAQPDTTGPGIAMYVNDPTFRNGEVAKPGSMLVAELSDSSGINMTGLGIGHQLTGILNGNENAVINLSSFYSAAENDFTKGQINYPLDDIPAGKHTFDVTVWDAFNNSSKASLEFEITESESLETGEILPFPNPFTSEVRFYIPHNQSGTNLRLEAKIYTMNGLLVRSLNKTFAGSSASEYLMWDTRDADGDIVSNGIYLVKVLVTDLARNTKKTSVLKILKNK